MSSWYSLAFWGFLGGAIVDGIEFWQAVRANHGRWPFSYQTAAYAVAEVIRLGSGAILAVALGLTGQVTAPMGALAIGIAAPIIVEKLSKKLPVIEGQPWMSDAEFERPRRCAEAEVDNLTSDAPNANEERA